MADWSSVTPEGQVESTVEPERRGRGTVENTGDPVIPESRRPTEDKHVTRFEQQGRDRVAPAHATEEKTCCFSQGDRDNRVARAEGDGAFVLVLVQPHSAVLSVEIDDADVGLEGKSGLG